MMACEWSFWKFWKGDNLAPAGGADFGSFDNDDDLKGDTEKHKDSTG